MAVEEHPLAPFLSTLHAFPLPEQLALSANDILLIVKAIMTAKAIVMKREYFFTLNSFEFDITILSLTKWPHNMRQELDIKFARRSWQCRDELPRQKAGSKMLPAMIWSKLIENRYFRIRSDLE